MIQKNIFIISILLAINYAFASIPIISSNDPKALTVGYGNEDISTNGEKLVIKNYLRPGHIVFDVGASVGNWALTAHEIEPNIQLFCFEPLPHVFRHLIYHLKPYTKNLFNFAFSDHIGRSKFYYFDDLSRSELSSFFLRPYYTRRILKSMQIETETIDHFCDIHRIDRIDYLKIDTEGSELHILKGAQKSLGQHLIIAVQFEYGGTYPDAGITLKEVMTLLTNAGYAIFRMSEHGIIHIAQWSNSLENNEYSNYFAILQTEVPEYNLVVFTD